MTPEDYRSINRMWDATREFEVQLARLGEDFVYDNIDLVNQARKLIWKVL